MHKKNDLSDKLRNDLKNHKPKELESVFIDSVSDLLKYESNESVVDFLDTMGSHGFLPCITRPSFLTPQSKTLIDNIFYT